MTQRFQPGDMGICDCGDTECEGLTPRRSNFATIIIGGALFAMMFFAWIS